MKSQSWETDADKLDVIRFCGLDSVRCGTALAVYLSGGYCYQTGAASSIVKCLKEILKYGCSYHYSEDSKVVFFYSYEYSGRRDYVDWWKKVVNLAPSSFVISPARKIHFFTCNYKYLLHVILWFFQMRKIRGGFSFKMACASLLLHGKIELDALRREIRKAGIHPRLFVCLCDVFVSDSVLTQYFNSIGVDTATLQHGFFTSWDNYSFVFTRSRAKYFLSWGDVTNRLGESFGAERSKFVITGPPQFIHCPVKSRIERKSIRTMAVFLNGPAVRQDNGAILQMVNQACADKGLRYYIRVHPAIPRSEIAPWIREEFFEGFLSNAESVYKSLERFQIAVTGNTTMFAELIFYMIPSFRYTESRTDMYGVPGLEWCRFTSAGELEQLIPDTPEQLETMEPKLIQTRDTLFQVDNIAEKYKDFFNK